MRKRAAVTEAEIARVVKGAIKGGLAPGSFSVVVEGSVIRLLPANDGGRLDDAMEIERRIREGCGTE